MANKMGKSLAPTVQAWLTNPTTPYVPLTDVGFGGNGVVMPQSLPPTSSVFPNASFNKMLNIPSTQAIYSTGRTGRIF